MAIGTTKVGALVANATVGPVTPLYPGSVANGDLAIAFVVARDSAAVITSASAAWERLDDWSTTGVRVYLFRRTWSTGDVATSFTSSAGTGTYAFTLAWSGANSRTVDQLLNPFPTVAASGTTTTMTANGVTTRTPGALAVYLYASLDDQAHGSASGGSTAVASGASYISATGNDIAVSAAVEAMPTPGATGGATMSHASGTDNNFLSVSFALRPLITVTGTATAPLGSLTGSVPNGHVDPTRGTSDTPLGALVTTSSGLRTTFGSESADLKPLRATSVGIRTTFGSASVSLGDLRTNITGGSVTALGGQDISLNPSVWLVDRPSQVLSPITGWTRIGLSPVNCAPGDVDISLAVGTPGFADIHGLVSANPQTDAEIEIWINGNGRGNGRKRAILYQKQGDDLDRDNVWSFSGHFLEQLLAEVLVGPDATETKETFFDGENPGTILATIFDRIQARSPLLLAGMTRDFTTSRDSNGQLWDETLGTIKYTPDTTLLEVAQDLFGLATCEFEVTANRVFRVYNFDSRGTDHTVGSAPMRFQHGSDLREVSRRESSRVGEAATAVLGKGDEGNYQWATNATAEAQRGRRVESPTDVGRLTSAAAVLAGAEARLVALSTGVQERSHSVAFTPGSPIPILDFDVCDYAMSVAGDGVFERMRIQQWKLVFEQGGTVAGDVVMNDLVQDWESITEARLNAIQRGGSVAGTSPRPPQVDDGKSPRAPFGVVVNSLAYVGPGGITLAAVTANWTPVTTNADLTALDDMAYYTPQFRYDVNQGLSTGWQSLATVQHPTSAVDFGGVHPGARADFRVAAVDRFDNVSAWSSTYSFVTATDAVAPPVPSVPLVESYLGILRVTWDGKGAAGEQQPGDYQRTEIHISTGQNFAPDRPLNDDGSLDERASTTFFDALAGAGDRGIAFATYDVTYYVKLVSVDRLNNASEASLAGHATLVQVADGDIAEVNIGKLRTGFLTAVMTVSNTIRTAASGSRVELDSNGIRCFFGSRKVFDFSIPTGALEIVGKLTSGLGVGNGATVIVDPEEVSVRYYPDNSGKYYRARASTTPLPLGGTGPVFEIASFGADDDYAGPQLLMWDDIFYVSPKNRGSQENNGQTQGPLFYTSGNDYYALLKTDISVGTITPADTHAANLELNDGIVSLDAHTALGISALTDNVVIDAGSNVTTTTGTHFTVTAGTNIFIRADGASGNGGELYLTDTGVAQLWNGASFKSFVIDHPLDARRYLVHACTETPDARVEYSGIAEVVDGVAWVELPDYFEALTRKDGRRVQVTCLLDDEPVPKIVMKPRIDGPEMDVPGRPGLKMRQGAMTLHPVEVPEHTMLPRVAASLPVGGRFRIASDQDGQISWTVSAIRNDAPGFVVEPLKSDVDVIGQAPYLSIIPKASEPGGQQLAG